MDIQLQELIDRIKKDGVACAEQQSGEIVSEAEKKAASIVAQAQQKADDLMKNAKAEIARLEKASEDALAQASRNMLLGFKDALIGELDAFVKAECAQVYSSKILEKLIPETVRNWTKNVDASDLSVLLSEKDLKDLESSLKAGLKEEISKGLEVKTDKTLANGFRIGINNGEAYYDYSAESVADLFAAYLNPRVAAIMKNSAKGSN